MEPYVDELRELVAIPDWVTEDADAHLMPHIEQTIAAEPDATLAGWHVADGVLEVDLETAVGTTVGRGRELAYRAIASIGEAVTYIRQAGTDPDAAFEVVTGMPPGSGEFATHGHRLTIRVRSASARR